MINLLSNKPVPPPAIQFTGGEPTVREDLPEIIRMAYDMGFVHTQVSSNGIKMAEDAEYCYSLKKAKLSTVYLQFDGVTPEPFIRARGVDLLDIKKRAISNLSEAGIRISGSSSGSSPNKVGQYPVGNITLSNVNISGMQETIFKAPSTLYPSGALVITRFLGLGNLSMSDVNLSSMAPNGLFLGTIAAGASTASGAGLGPDLGDLVLDGTFTNNIMLGKHGNSGSYVPTDIDIDATGVTFQGALSDAYIEARIHHWNDDLLLGLIDWTTP